MDDEEIVKLWGSIGGEIHIKEAIRLYRMAEANTGLEYEKMLLKQDINCNQLLKQARADEREKCNWAHNEAYAKGKAECQATYANLEDVYKTQFQEGYKKGQADLIEKLTSDKFIIGMLNAYEQVPDMMAGSYTKNELYRNEQAKISAVKETIKKASESLGNKKKED